MGQFHQHFLRAFYVQIFGAKNSHKKTSAKNVDEFDTLLQMSISVFHFLQNRGCSSSRDLQIPRLECLRSRSPIRYRIDGSQANTELFVWKERRIQCSYFKDIRSGVLNKALRSDRLVLIDTIGIKSVTHELYKRNGEELPLFSTRAQV